MCGRRFYFIVITAFMSLVAGTLSAQNKVGDNEIRVSYGGVANLGYDFRYAENDDYSIYSYLISNLGTPQDVRQSGVISLSYDYFVKNWLSVGGTLGTAFFYTEYQNNYMADPTLAASWSEWSHGLVSVMAGARFHFLNKKWVRLYADVNVGVNMLYARNNSSVMADFAFQTSPFGISIGKKVSGFLELDFGTLYNGGNIGISVKF